MTCKSTGAIIAPSITIAIASSIIAIATSVAVASPAVTTPAPASTVPAKIWPTPGIAIRGVTASRVVVGIASIYISAVWNSDADPNAHLRTCLGR
jgi:hypothetical protein